MSVLSHLPTLTEAQRERRACSKGPSRLEIQAAEAKRTVIDDAAFRREVWERDKGLCRVCGVKVKKQVARHQLRGEVHHIHGRTGDLRHDARAAILACAKCHERLTGKVNDRLFIVASKTFLLHGQPYTDARAPISFTDLHGRRT